MRRMKQGKLTAAKLALIGLACFLSAAVWTFIRIRTEELPKLLSPSGGSFVTNTDWKPVPFDPVLLVGVTGLIVFAGACLFALTNILRRRLRRPPDSATT